jgi:hypothetical protein
VRRDLLFLLGLAGILSASPLEAQTVGTPVLKSPYPNFKHSELGAYLSDPGEGVSIALQGEYRIARPKFDFGGTVAYLDESNTDDLIGIGVDGRIRVVRRTTDFPLDGSLTIGAGVLLGGDHATFSIPLGITMGRQLLLEGSSVMFTPYVAPVLLPVFGGGNSQLDFALGLGVDISLSRLWDIRVSGSLGDLEGVGIGLAWHR